MRKTNIGPIRLLVRLALVAFAAASVGCDTTTYVGVSYGYVGWGGPVW